MDWFENPVWRQRPLGAGWQDEKSDVLVWISIAKLDAERSGGDEYVCKGTRIAISGAMRTH